jgi:hypothetical protein
MYFTEMVPLMRKYLPITTTAESKKTNQTNKPTDEDGVFVLEGDMSTIE